MASYGSEISETAPVSGKKSYTLFAHLFSRLSKSFLWSLLLEAFFSLTRFPRALIQKPFSLLLHYPFCCFALLCFLVCFLVAFLVAFCVRVRCWDLNFRHRLGCAKGSKIDGIGNLRFNNKNGSCDWWVDDDDDETVYDVMTWTWEWASGSELRWWWTGCLDFGQTQKTRKSWDGGGSLCTTRFLPFAKVASILLCNILPIPS